MEHLRWECEAFEPERVQVDPKLANIPRKYVAACIKCGIAPAMEVEGEKTFWGRELGEGESEDVKRMLGVDMQLHKTRARTRRRQVEGKKL